MNVPISKAFSMFEDWKNKKSALSIMMGPSRKTEGIGGGVKHSGIVIKVLLASEEVIVLVGSPETGQKELLFKVSGASFAADESPLCLTVELSGGGLIFFVEKSPTDIGQAPVEKRNTQ